MIVRDDRVEVPVCKQVQPRRRRGGRLDDDAVVFALEILLGDRQQRRFVVDV
jgi:hypothetical protein